MWFFQLEFITLSAILPEKKKSPSRRRHRIIAIDGPAGAGKSTTARLLAKKLGFTYLDTGAIYRALTRAALDRGIDLRDQAALLQLIANLDFRIEPGPNTTRIWVDGQEVTDKIRTAELTRHVKFVAALPEVRNRMVTLQRQIATQGDFVVEGRDIGTVVFPQADLKVYLTASVEARTRRRLEELKTRGETANYEKLRHEIEERDRLDRERETSPLRRAADAVDLDTTAMSIDDQVEAIVNLFREKVE